MKPTTIKRGAMLTAAAAALLLLSGCGNKVTKLEDACDDYDDVFPDGIDCECFAEEAADELSGGEVNDLITALERLDEDDDDDEAFDDASFRVFRIYQESITEQDCYE